MGDEALRYIDDMVTARGYVVGTASLRSTVTARNDRDAGIEGGGGA